MSKLFEPITINNLQLKNRIVMPPMATSKTKDDGKVNEDLIAYYDDKSKNGMLGLIITEHSFINPDGRAHKGQVSISCDNDIPGLKALTDAIHANNTPVFAQLSHAGAASSPVEEGHLAKGPSSAPIPGKRNIATSLEMSQEDIEQIIEDFAEAAIRAKEAGYDGVEIHSAHGYLLNQFYSPLTNKRTDTYNGNTLDGRIHLHLQIIEAIRNAVGKDYPISLRLGACDYMEGGSTVEDALKAVQAFEKAGIDLISITGGLNGFLNPTCKDQGYFKELSKPIKEAVSIPVLLTGGITEPAAAEALLEEEAADLIGVGRVLFRDANWPVHAKEALEN